MLAVTILWLYPFFAQYLIIWYANLPDQTGRLLQLQHGPFSRLFWRFFVLKFVIRFLVLIFPFALYASRVSGDHLTAPVGAALRHERFSALL